MTPFEAYCRLHYLSEKERDRVATIGNIVRIATTILVNINLKKEKQIKDPRKLWRFGWEEEEGKENTNVQEVTPSDLMRISELL